MILRLEGRDIFLYTMEREDCPVIWQNYEYDFEQLSEPLNLGYSVEKADTWFDDIQRDRGHRHVRLGIFLHDGGVIGDIALEDIDRNHRSCTLGMGIARLERRSKGYGRRAVSLILRHAFCDLGLQRVSVNTLEANLAARRSLEHSGFVLEGVERKAIYLAGQKYDRLHYAMLRKEYLEGGRCNRA